METLPLQINNFYSHDGMFDDRLNDGRPVNKMCN